MNFNFSIGKLRVNLGDAPAKQLQRGYTASNMNRLNSDWLMPQTSADAEVLAGLVALRGRARELERNNEYVQRYLSLLDNNVLGHCGVGLQMKISDPSGTLDKLANDVVKKAWDKWSQRAYCTPSGQMCWREVEGMVLRRAACDGGILLRIIRGWDNPFSFSVQPLEIDHLDHTLNLRLTNGGEIRFGIEFDAWRKPVAMHLFKAHPGDNVNNGRQRERVPASDILHIFWSERPGQSAGVPWFTSVMQALEHLGKYREAHLVAARISACAGFAIETTAPDSFSGDIGANGEQLQEMTPGMSMRLNPGEKLNVINPSNPNPNAAGFVKDSLRGIAGGLSIGYNSLANDWADANFSSMRASRLEEVEEWKNVQGWLIESLHIPVFTAWLEMSLIAGSLRMGNGSALPLTKLDKFNAPDWKPRRWPWVDPKADADAAVFLIEKGLKSRRETISEMGGDIEEVFLEQYEDEELADKYELEFPIGLNPQQPMDTETPPKEELTPAPK